MKQNSEDDLDPKDIAAPQALNWEQLEQFHQSIWADQTTKILAHHEAERVTIVEAIREECGEPLFDSEWWPLDPTYDEEATLYASKHDKYIVWTGQRIGIWFLPSITKEPNRIVLARNVGGLAEDEILAVIEVNDDLAKLATVEGQSATTASLERAFGNNDELRRRNTWYYIAPGLADFVESLSEEDQLKLSLDFEHAVSTVLDRWTGTESIDGAMLTLLDTDKTKEQ